MFAGVRGAKRDRVILDPRRVREERSQGHLLRRYFRQIAADRRVEIDLSAFGEDGARQTGVRLRRRSDVVLGLCVAPEVVLDVAETDAPNVERLAVADDRNADARRVWNVAESLLDETVDVASRRILNRGGRRAGCPGDPREEETFVDH